MPDPTPVTAALAVPNAHAPYLIDAGGEVWKVVRDGGMLTRADYSGITSVGIAWAFEHMGPFVPFDPERYLAAWKEANDG